MGRHYVGSDGNGGYKVSKSIAIPAMITLGIFILGLLVQGVWATSQMKYDLEIVKQEIKMAQTEHPKRLAELQEQDRECELRMVRIETKLDSIEALQIEIRQILKEHNFN